MAQLFTPPARTQVTRMEGSLTYSFDVSLTVWKKDGQWFALETPPFETLAAADIVLAGRPQVVSDALAADLLTSGIGGTLNPFTP